MKITLNGKIYDGHVKMKVHDEKQVQKGLIFFETNGHSTEYNKDCQKHYLCIDNMEIEIKGEFK